LDYRPVVAVREAGAGVLLLLAPVEVDMSKHRVTSVAEVVGGVAVVVGVGMVSLAAGLVVGGLVAWLFAWRVGE